MKNEKSDPENAVPRKSRGVEIFLSILISSVIASIGVLSVMSETYVGKTKQGKELVLQGGDAVLFGYGLIVFGLFPMAMAMPKKKWAMIWMGITIPIGLFLMIFRVFFK